MIIKRVFPFILSVLLIFSLIMEPISLFASQENYEKENHDNIFPIKILENIDYQGITITEGTILYAILNDKNQYLVPTNDSNLLELPDSTFELVEHNENLPTFISQEELEYKYDKTFLIDDTFINEYEKGIDSISINLEEVSLPIYKVGDSEGIYVGFRLFIYDNTDTESMDSNEQKPGQDEPENGNDKKIDEENLNHDSDLVGSDKLVDSPDSMKDGKEIDRQEELTNDNLDRQKQESIKQEKLPKIQTFRFDTQATKLQLQTVDPWSNSKARYFEVIEEDLTVFDNRSGKLVEIGKLTKGQTYPIVSDYGNWHRIQFGSYYGYVWKKSTLPSNGNKIPNENKSYKNQNRSITSITDVAVYDNSSGSLVKFGELSKGTSIAIASDYGNWWRIVYAGRVGYVNKSGVKADFQKGDKFFRVISNDAPIYDNRSGKLVPVGSLTKGQVYQIDRDYGNWWRIQFNNYYAYVHKNQTEYATNNLKNINSSYKHSNRTIVPFNDVPVYDNSSGKLVKFGEIKKNISYRVASDYGNWWRIIYADRIGYVAKSSVKANFISTDKYFVAHENLTVYDNRTGKLVKVGELIKGQEYPITSNYGNWWRIKFSNFYGYVHKSGTGAVTRPKINNENKTYTNSNITITTSERTTVYDNSSGKLVPFGVIESNVKYPIVSNYGPNWFRILFNDRVGYIHKSTTKSYEVTNYNYSLNEMINKQMTVSPQTDAYRNKPIWVHSSNLSVSGSTVRLKGKITGNRVNIRSNANTNSSTIDTVNKGTQFVYLGNVTGSPVSGSTTWYKINYGGEIGYVHSSLANIRIPYYESPSSSSHLYGTTSFVSTSYRNKSGQWYQLNLSITWRNAKRADVEKYVNPDKQDMYQFLVLSESVNLSPASINRVLQGKGVLHNKGQAYIDASKKYGVNEIYLISHSLLETGNGTSQLAKGVEVGKNSNGTPTLVNSSNRNKLKDIKKVYNMYGIGANDNCALSCGATYAYNHNWTSVNTAIIEGAAFVSNNYFARGQNTLYKMRWNPANPGTYQYATDVAWAHKQISRIKDLYSQLTDPMMTFDIPKYK